MSEPWGGTQPEQMSFHCDNCGGPVLLTIVERWWTYPQDQGASEFEPFEQALAKCTGCGLAYVLGRITDYLDETDPLEQWYPEVGLRLPSNVPKSIRDSHEEAIKCRRAQCHTASVLMARRGVEAICSENGEAKGPLEKKLEALKAAGVIDSRLHDWSSVVRTLGNSGAHDVDEALSREDADDAIAFFEALVNYLYTFKQRYEQHVQRKSTEGLMKEIFGPDHDKITEISLDQ